MLLLAAACHGDVFVRLSITGIPAGASALLVTASAGGRDADPLRFPLPSTDDQTLAIKAPSGWLELGVAALDARDCDLAWQTTALAPGSFDTHVLDLGLPLDPVSPATCGLVRSPGMAYVATDSFILGCAPGDDPSCATDETPDRVLTLPAFEIDRVEVSVGAYADCVSAGACTPPLDEGTFAAQTLPPAAARDSVDWSQASAFCAWRKKRLPSEAEWEAAARGTDGRLYPWGNDSPTCALANFSAGGSLDGSCFGADRTKNLVGQDAAGASPYGVLDLAGNLSEWTADWYAVRSSLTDAQLATGPASGTARVVKGGSYLLSGEFLRAASRSGWPPVGAVVLTTGDVLDPATATIERGFRCAR